MPMSPRLLRPRASGDPDAGRYIAAVQDADGQALEPAVRQAIEAFVRGCKSDGIWSAVKASCILMGARTLSGALTPLVGAAPTNNGPFVSGDYNRKTGLVGNGSTKYLNSNRNNNADPQDDQHLAVYATTAATSAAAQFPVYIGSGASESGSTHIGRLQNNGVLYSRHRSSLFGSHGTSSGAATGFIGISRASGSSYDVRLNNATQSVTVASQAPLNAGLLVFASNQFGGVLGGSHSNARVAFYSIGAGVNMSALDSRVTTLYNAIGAAI